MHYVILFYGVLYYCVCACVYEQLESLSPCPRVVTLIRSVVSNRHTIHWLSLLCVDIILTVPRTGSFLIVSVCIVTKFVTDLHIDC